MACNLSRRRSEHGNALVEFTLVGIPLVFMLLAIFEVSRAMWVYTTMAHTLRDSLRYAIVHGNDCGVFPNGCRTQVRDVVGRIKTQGLGLLDADFRDIKLISISPTEPIITCATVSACTTNGGDSIKFWPPADAGGGKESDIEITGQYRFQSAIIFFWPGSRSWRFGEQWFTASSKESIRY